MKECFSSQKCKNYPRLRTSRSTNDATLSLWWGTSPPIVSATCLRKIMSLKTRKQNLYAWHPSDYSFGITAKSSQNPTQDGALARESIEFCVLLLLLPHLFKPEAPPPPPPQSQPAEQLSHSSSNTQGGRTRLCMRQMASAWCNILGQGRYFQKGFSFFFFISFFSISRFTLLYRGKKQMPVWPQGGS